MIALVVLISLTLTLVIVPRAGHVNVVRKVRRSLIVGTITVLVSYFVSRFAF